MEFWGKLSSDLKFQLSLTDHCVDVACVFRALCDLPAIRRSLGIDATTMDRLAVFALLHDLGKCNTGFQARRPATPFQQPRQHTFPPRTRGSTCADRDIPGEGLVSPAHAGIDLTGLADPTSAQGFPRARGDRPRSGLRFGRWLRFPPRTRGSTLADPAQAQRSDNCRRPGR